MSSIEQIIADHKRKQAEAEAKKVVMTRREWLEYLPKEYQELCKAVHKPEWSSDRVESMHNAILHGGVNCDSWIFWHDRFWLYLCNWAEGKRTTLPPIPGIHKDPIPWPQPDLSKKPVQKEYHPLADVSVRDKPAIEDKPSKETMLRGEWFELLPKKYRDYCNLYVGNLSEPCESMYIALVGGAPIAVRPNAGTEFWYQMVYWARGDRDSLPPIPGITKEPLPYKSPANSSIIKEGMQQDDTTDQPAEIITTRHTIPYNGGNLPLFASL